MIIATYLVKDDSDIATVKGDVTITFPLMISAVLEKLADEGVIKTKE